MCFDPDGVEPEACYAGGDPGTGGSLERKDAEGNVTSTVTRSALEPNAEANGLSTVPPAAD